MFLTFKGFLNTRFARMLSEEELQELHFLTKIFPFKASRYVLDELIDWQHRDSDPIYRLIFPKPEMLERQHWQLLKSAKTFAEEKEAAQKIRNELNPHPNGQKLNIPVIDGRSFGGLQHKYKETVLFFPAQGQTCHSYCSYCFRWAQFVNLNDHKFKMKHHNDLFDYLSQKREVTDVLITGGDPLWMNNEQLFSYLDVLLSPELHHIKNIRIGSKSLAFYPQRYLGIDGDILLDKFERIIQRGKNIALMAHFSHPRELETNKAALAVKRLREAGVVIRTQAPLIRGINNSSEIWKEMWEKQVNMGMIPYYMFVERDTGAHHYFSVPLYKAYDIFTNAYSQVSGLAKTVRGPSMSAWPGKILINGTAEQDGEKKFVLSFIQARDEKLINKPFFAEFNKDASWLSDLRIESPMKERLAELQDEYSEDLGEVHEVA